MSLRGMKRSEMTKQSLVKIRLREIASLPAGRQGSLRSLAMTKLILGLTLGLFYLIITYS